MSTDLFDFGVILHQDGYRWIEATRMQSSHCLPQAYLVPCNLMGEWKSYNPLIEVTGLFRHFAQLDTNKESILAFTNRYGMLGKIGGLVVPVGVDPWRYNPPKPGDALKDWQESVNYMKLVVDMWDMIRSGDTKGLSKYLSWTSDTQLSVKVEPPIGNDPFFLWEGTLDVEDLGIECEPSDLVRPARKLIALCIDYNLRPTSSINVRSLDEDTMQLYIKVAGLHNAVWFQLARAIIGNKDYRQCRTCSSWYELHPDTARTNRLSCSDACRAKAYRQRQAQARRLFREGIPIDEIARQLNTEPMTVQTWVSRKR